MFGLFINLVYAINKIKIMNKDQLRHKFLMLLKRNDLSKEQIQRCTDFLRIYGNFHKPKQTKIK